MSILSSTLSRRVHVDTSAAAKYANPLHKELTYHYVHERGAPFALTKDNMTQVITYEFKSTVRWFDYWNFDPMRPAQPDEEAQAQPAWRTKGAEEGVRMTATSLPGVRSTSIPKTSRSRKRTPIHRQTGNLE